MKKLLLSLIILYVLLATCNLPAYAHVGGGPPFLVVDGVYAITNPYFFNDPTINIPQDYTGHTYLVNKPINLYVDTDKLLVPPDIAKASTFRWTMRENSKDYKFGQKLEQTYTKTGSYIITLEVKAPGETEYTVIDTVQLDVLPNTNYKLPTAKMAIATDHGISTKPIFFQSSYSTDSSAKVDSIIWGFGDGSTSTQKNVLHTYANMQDYSTFPIVFRVRDTNNFNGYAGIIIVADKGKLHFVDNNGKEHTIPVKDTLPSNANGDSNVQNQTDQHLMLESFLVLGGIIAGAVIISVIVILIRRRK